MKNVSKYHWQQLNFRTIRISLFLVFVFLVAASVASDAFASHSDQKKMEQESSDWVETALDFYVGGQYYGYVYVAYADDWVELLDPQQAIYLLPLINDRHAMTELFTGRIYGQRKVDKLGTVKVDPSNFSIYVTLSPEQTVRSPKDKNTIHETNLEGQPTFLSQFRARGTFPVRSDLAGDASKNRFTLWNNTYLTGGPFRLSTSGTWIDQKEEYDLRVLKGEYELTFSDHPFVLAGGLIDLPGQEMVSSVDVLGVSLTTSKQRYDSQVQRRGTPLEVYVPTRALVEVFRESADRGELLFSRVLESGFQQIDVNQFPRGSYQVEIVISANGAEISRETERFYRYDEILPRERYDINLTVGTARRETDWLSVPIAYASLRMRVTDYLESGFSAYAVDDRVYFSESLVGFWQNGNRQEWRYDLNMTQSTESALLGVSGSLSWRLDRTSVYFSFLRSLSEAPLYAENQNLLTFERRIQLNASLSHSMDLFNRAFYFSFNARRRNGEDQTNDWRYGPQLRLNLWQQRESTLAFSTSFYRTNDGNEKQIQLTYTWRPKSHPHLNAQSRLDTTWAKSTDTIQWQNSIHYNGDNSSPSVLKNTKLEAIVTRNQRNPEEIAGQSDTLSYLGFERRGRYADVKLYANSNSNRRGVVIGGELDTTILSGSKSLFQVSRSIPFDNALVAVKVTGETDTTAELAVLVNDQIKGYTRVGESVLVEVPAFRASTVAVEQIRTDQELLLIPENKTTVRPYPRNVLHRTFDVMRVIIVAGRLVNSAGDPFADSFVETGFDPAYTDEDGEFIIEVPVGKSGRKMKFLVHDQTCHFNVGYTTNFNSITEIGNIQCRLASQAEIRQVREQHGIDRTIGFKSALRNDE